MTWTLLLVCLVLAAIAVPLVLACLATLHHPKPW